MSELTSTRPSTQAGSTDVIYTEPNLYEATMSPLMYSYSDRIKFSNDGTTLRLELLKDTRLRCGCDSSRIVTLQKGSSWTHRGRGWNLDPTSIIVHEPDQASDDHAADDVGPEWVLVSGERSKVNPLDTSLDYIYELFVVKDQPE